MKLKRFSSVLVATILVFLCGYAPEVFAQSVGIASTNITPNTNSVLELRSTNKGVLLPRLTSLEKSALTASLGSGDEGMTFYNTTDHAYEFWNGSGWVVMGTAGGYDDDWTVVGGDVKRQSGNVYVGDNSGTDNDIYISGLLIDWDNSNYFVDPSAAAGSRLNEVEFDDGSTSDPSVWFDGDANSGIYQPANNQIGIVAAGNQRLRVVSSGVSIGGNTDSPNTLLDVVGGVSGASTTVMTLRSDFTADNTGTALRLINSSSNTSDVGSELQALSTNSTNGFSALVLKVHGSGGASGDLEERMRINGDGEVIIGSNGFRGKLSFFAEQGGTDYKVTFASNPSTSQDVNYTLPPDDGDSDYVLRTDGSGILTWADPALLPSDADWTISGSDMNSGVSGNVGIGTASPYSKLELYDANGPSLTITKDGADASNIFFRNGTGGGVNDGTRFGLSSAEHFELTNSISNKDMFFNVNVAGTPTDVLFIDGGTGRVGVNDVTPGYDLEIGGNVGVDTDIIHGGDDDTKISFTTNRIQMFAGSSSSSWMDIQSAGSELTINENDLQRDFRVEGGTDENLLFADGSSDKVGIGTGAPLAKLHVQDVAGSSAFTARFTKNSNTVGELVGVGFGSDAVYNRIKSAIVHERVDNVGVGKLHFLVDGDAYDNDVTLADSRMTIDRDGLVGIGETVPTEELHVAGDILSTALAAGGNVQADGFGKLIISSDIPAGDADYIHNQNVLDQSADLRISGDARIGGVATIGFTNMLHGGALHQQQLRLRDGDDGNHWLAYHDGGGFDGAKLYGLQTVALQTSNMEVVLRDSRMGVGTPSPSKGRLHVAGWHWDYINAGTYFSAGFGGLSPFGTGNHDISIYGERHILAGWGVLTESDARIKNIQGISDAATDLETLTQIEITDYTMKDYVQAGNDAYKKVIAQQVESVYPLAVSSTTNFIPNVYELTQMENGKANIVTELEEGDKVKLFINDSEETIAKVVSKTNNSVSLDLEYTGKAFIYGKEVDDFKIVDYEAIAMLNVSATQELYSLILNLQQENADVKAELGRIDDLSSELEEIKASLGIGLQSSK